MITNGTVKFLRRVNLGNYEHKEASVELTVANPDGYVSDETLEVTTRLAVAKAYEMLAEFKDAPSREVHQPPTPTLVGAAHSPVASSVTTSLGGPTPPALVGNTSISPTNTDPSATPSPVVLVGGSVAPDPTLIGAPAALGAASPALISTGVASAPAEITDADLVLAITAANARMFARATTEEQKVMVPRNLGAALLAHLPKEFHGSPKVQQILPHLRPAALAAFNAL